jgi:hypothetical protein
VTVTLRGGRSPAVSLELAPNGVTIVEFPAADRFFAVHPGNSDLVTLDDSPTKATDHFLVLRAGSGFVAPGSGSGARRPLASLVVQMQSGLVLTFLLHPAPSLASQVHRCVVRYDRREVVAARLEAGLAVDLGLAGHSTGQTEAAQVTAVPTPSPAQPAPSPPPRASVAAAPGTAAAGADRTTAATAGEKKEGPDLRRAALGAMNDALRSTTAFRLWTGARHDLALSTSPVRELDERSRVVVVAVRNKGAAPVRTLPGQPDLYVETVDGQGRAVQIEAVNKLHTETTAAGGEIAPGATVYYALVYESPVLGAS